MKIIVKVYKAIRQTTYHKNFSQNNNITTKATFFIKYKI